MPPTPRSTKPTLTSGRSSFLRLSVTASSEPCTSALTMRLSIACSPAWIWAKMSSSLAPELMTEASGPAGLPLPVARVSRPPNVALRSSGATTKSSPASATSESPSTWTGVDGPRFLDLLALVVDQRPDATPGRTGDQRVADLQRAALHQHRGHRATADVEVCLEDDARGASVGVGPQVLDLGDDQQVLEQLVDAQCPSSAETSHMIVSPPHASGTRPCSESCCITRFGIGVLAVDLVDRDHDRHLGRLGVRDGLDRLGHHPVVGRHHEDHDVGGLGATGAHGGERLVARGVDEGERPAVLDRPGRHRCAG